MLTIDLMAVGQILGAVATFAAIITFLRSQKKIAQDEGKAMQQIKDMQDKIACHEDQIEALEKSDTSKNVVIAEIKRDLSYILKKLDDLAQKFERYMEMEKKP